jgi:tetratricopeptide (TPR) repeat protein
LRFQGKYPEAEGYYKRALEVRQKALGALHKEEVVILENYAKLLRQLGREAEAKKLEDRAMGIMRR